MAARGPAAFRVGEWTIGFKPATGVLECRHWSSRTRVAGTLSFQPQGGDGPDGWTIDVGPDADVNRLGLLNARGECVGYVVMSGEEDLLRVDVIQRGMQKFRGTLRFEGAASLGKETFACRTRPPRPADRVVQMAAGPADSRLNDSLFDVGRDEALVFTGADASVVLDRTAGKAIPVFAVQAAAHVHDSAQCYIGLEVQQGYYRRRYVPRYKPVDKERCPSPPTGWMSWNVYFDQAGEKENLAEARVAARTLKPYGLEIWSIESWQDNSAALPVRTFHNLTLRPFAQQFPHGMKWLAEQIRKLGFRPGIWTVPFGTGDEAYYQKHEDWFLHDEHGTPMSNWCGRFVLDPSQPAVRRHMEETHRTMAEEWGYEFFKIDGMSGKSASYSAHFYELAQVQQAFQTPCSNPYERCVQALRKGIGPDRTLLACQGHYTGPEVAAADAARIGADIVSPNHPPQWHNYLDQAQTTLAQLFVHNIVWYSDPDTLLVGKAAATGVARAATTVVALPGQMMFAGDKLAELPAGRIWLLQRSLPVCDVRPLDLYPIYDLKPVWTLKVDRPFAQWDVVSLFNWDEDAEKTVAATMEELGLDPQGQYLAYEYWSRKFLGTVKGKLEATAKPRSNALIALHPSLGRPQFLSTDRHVTQGATSLQGLEWDETACTLRGTTALVSCEPTTLTLHVPQGYRLESAAAAGARVVRVRQRRDRTAVLVLESQRPRSAEWTVAFARTRNAPR